MTAIDNAGPDKDAVPESDEAGQDGGGGAGYRVSAGELRQFLERFERLEAEKQDVAAQQREVMSEAKSRGYDTKILRRLVALRKRDADDVAEEEAILEMYKDALGM